MNPISKSTPNPQKPVVQNSKEKTQGKNDKKTSALQGEVKSSKAAQVNLSDKKGSEPAATYSPQEMKAKAKFFLESDIPNSEERAVLEEIVATDIADM